MACILVQVVQLESEFHAILVLNGFSKLEETGMVLTNSVARAPSGIARIVVNRQGRGELLVVLKQGVSGIDQIDWLTFALGANWLGKDTQLAEDKIAVTGSPRAFFL